jgi:hypothetical protein
MPGVTFLGWTTIPPTSPTKMIYLNAILKKKSQPISLKKGTTISSGIARRGKIE